MQLHNATSQHVQCPPHNCLFTHTNTQHSANTHVQQQQQWQQQLYMCISHLFSFVSPLFLFSLSSLQQFFTTTVHYPTVRPVRGDNIYVCGKVSLQAGDKGSNSMQLHMDTCNPPSSRSIVKSSEGAINNL